MSLPQQDTARPKLRVISGSNNVAKSDAELILAVQQDKDAAAFETLVKRYQRVVYNVLYQLAPDWNNTADMTQEVFIRAWRSIHNLRNPKAFRAWISQIATNLFYDELRKRPKSLPTISMDEPMDPDDHDDATRDIADTSALPDECAQRKELAEVIRIAMGKLPEQFRTAIVLRELQGLSYEEISLLTQTEMGTVKSRIARARNKVQELLAPYLRSA